MKKIALCVITICLLLTFQPQPTNAANTAVSSGLVTSKPVESAEAKTLLLRLDEINVMDKSTLTSSEKKNLRKEVRSIRSCNYYCIAADYFTLNKYKSWEIYFMLSL